MSWDVRKAQKPGHDVPCSPSIPQSLIRDGTAYVVYDLPISFTYLKGILFYPQME